MSENKDLKAIKEVLKGLPVYEYKAKIINDALKNIENEIKFMKGLLGSKYPCNSEKFCVFSIGGKCHCHYSCDHRGKQDKNEVCSMSYNEHVIKIKEETEWLENNQNKLEGKIPTICTKLHLAAEHLQAEINFLKSEIAKLKDGYKVALEIVEAEKKEKEEIQENLRRRNAEVTRLKHELQSKIEVVRCEECKNQNSNCECPFFDTIQYIKVDFCSAGVHKDGESK